MVSEEKEMIIKWLEEIEQGISIQTIRRKLENYYNAHDALLNDLLKKDLERAIAEEHFNSTSG